MDKFKEIRPIALGVAVRDNKLLVSEGYDKIKNETFYRCLGGGIEFAEKGEEALKREFVEEIDAKITVNKLIGISENIFTFQGKKAHEIVLLYSINLDDSDYKEEYKILDEKDSKAVWVDIDDFKNNKKILYPENMVNYI